MERETQINFRMTKEFKEMMVGKATARGLKVSEYLRFLILTDNI